jgi:histone deacetylase 1/2
VDILFGVGLVSRFMKTPVMTHFKALKRILWYIKGTVDFGFFYGYSYSFELGDHSDSNWAGDMDDRKSTKYIFFLYGRHNINMEFKEAIHNHFVNMWS